MSNYQPHWDLTTIPDGPFNSERGRRHALKGSQQSNMKLRPCDQCGNALNATQRRKPCPNCGHTHPRKAAK